MTPSTSPRFASALSTHTDPERAEAEAVERLVAGLGGREPDLVVAFATHHYGVALEQLGPRLANATGAGTVLGCTCENVIGGTREVEGSRALSLWGAALPGARLTPFALEAEPDDQGRAVFPGGPADLGESSFLLVLADPFTFPMNLYLEFLNERHPGLPAIGGMASGASGPGQTLLLTESGFRYSGCIGLAVSGGVRLCPVVSQGCRPVGEPWVVTARQDNLVKTLGGRPGAEVLLETLESLAGEDRELFQRGPFVGLAIDATKSEFEREDFVVRPVGLHRESGSVAVGDRVRLGQTIQFLVRDAASASDDLRLLMRRQGGGPADPEPGSVGALLFSCNGRGQRMFEVPDHDASCIHEGLGSQVPLAGFFAAGEVGPVGGRNFLHGFTASVAILRGV